MFIYDVLDYNINLYTCYSTDGDGYISVHVRRSDLSVENLSSTRLYHAAKKDESSE